MTGALVPLGDAAGRSRWTVEQDGRGYLVIELPTGLVVTDALCPHKQLPLADGVVRDGALVCPGHWYAYDLSTGDCRTTGDVTLPIYPVVTVDGSHFAQVPEAAPVLSWSERLRAHAREGTAGSTMSS
jgi:nitrite reductase/ring-hydroxylating ferredoxin subunit